MPDRPTVRRRHTCPSWRQSFSCRACQDDLIAWLRRVSAANPSMSDVTPDAAGLHIHPGDVTTGVGS